jgi:uncharacterized protein YnzC (UPF0291/DUF896 family)
MSLIQGGMAAANPPFCRYSSFFIEIYVHKQVRRSVIMEKDKIYRINELAQKARTEGLSEAEKEEQQKLRKQYIADLRKNFEINMENVFLVDKDGKQTQLQKK